MPCGASQETEGESGNCGPGDLVWFPWERQSEVSGLPSAGSGAQGLSLAAWSLGPGDEGRWPRV